MCLVAAEGQQEACMATIRTAVQTFALAEQAFCREPEQTWRLLKPIQTSLKG